VAEPPPRLLRARVSAAENYRAPQPGQGPKPPIVPDAHVHASELLTQLDAMQAHVAARGVARDQDASRELVAIHPGSQIPVNPTQVGSVRQAPVIGVTAEGVVLLDAKSPELDYLRSKVEAFGDDNQVAFKTKKDGTPKLDADGKQVLARAAEAAVAPIAKIALASLEDRSGARFRATNLADDLPFWFEVACRGGYLHPRESERSRGQVSRQLYRLGNTEPFDEFRGPELVYFLLRLTVAQLRELVLATDCIFEFDLAPPPLRDMKLLEETSTRDLRSFKLVPPPHDAPSVVVLDTGIATEHPLLKPAILSATWADAGLASPEDRHGHGTKMAGIVLYPDLGGAIEAGTFQASHWIQSSRLLVKPAEGTASDKHRELWPKLTEIAVQRAEEADANERGRAFVLAVTRSMQDVSNGDIEPTLWSHAIDKLAYGNGSGRLMIVSAGNARLEQWSTLAELYPGLQLTELIHEPAQASNALVVGAFTNRTELPPQSIYAEATVVAKDPGGISPFTSTGPGGTSWPIKPDVLMEGGNLAFSATLSDANVPTLSALTASNKHNVGQPLVHLNMTSEAAARAASLAAQVWSAEPGLWPETVRALIVHSASWTAVMSDQFPNPRDRLRACGYGVPDERLATQCAQNIATIVIEGVMPNQATEEVPKKEPPKRPTTKTTQSVKRRRVKFYKVPIPDGLLPHGDDPDVELRVTLSYLPEPSRFGATMYHGLDLKWDMQGPQEPEAAFKKRINKLRRERDAKGKTEKPTTKSFKWDIGVQARSRGTVQSDRWRGKMSELAGDKLIAIVPVLGWWDKRTKLKCREMRFALIVSVFAPGAYAAIKPQVEAQPQIEQEVLIEI
jgi:hypothetical protein